MQTPANLIVILATGGTIAGTAQSATDGVGYTAAQLRVEDLLTAIPGLATRQLEAHQLAQLDSKDMDFATWQLLANAVQAQLDRSEVGGIVITHGTDTLEETAYFLHRVLAPTKPVVLTAAMRPATALAADGPQNLLDAVHVAATPDAAGVVVAFAGRVHDATQVRKAHSYRVDAFESTDGALVARVEEGAVRLLGRWPQGEALGLAHIAKPVQDWPRVDVVINHAGQDGRIVQALLAAGVDGIVAAGTGNGTLSVALDAALRDAEARGVRVVRSTRCDAGPVMALPGLLPSAGALSPVKARIELILSLLAA
ncbi:MULTISPECIES: asparaginase [unclassified Roseateles]|uniref:asparaginase n=1 Tax=unclassified Roseateles TaxID=2626991 RepID=UPI0006F254FF|nr:MULTISPECIES: asparaginase [unclassified Roseateles]KQW43524.1 L-asparaginase [Pelomonas sp. Root405]KRA71262.1 L-asparaginase [Pelomonas sp. Root662]